MLTTPQRKRARAALEIIFFIVLFLALRMYMQRDLVKGTAPALIGTTLSGTLFSLRDFHGRPAIIHFWATWCPICHAEQGSIVALAHDYAIITIAMQSGTAVEVRNYLQQQKIELPVLVDSDGTLAEKYGVRAVPTTFFIDGNGMIRYVEVGFTSEWGLRLRLWLIKIESRLSPQIPIDPYRSL